MSLTKYMLDGHAMGTDERSRCGPRDVKAPPWLPDLLPDATDVDRLKRDQVV